MSGTQEEEVHSTCDLACEILEKTNDGNDLSPEHLGLLQDAVNGYLNGKGEKMLKEIHTQVMKDSYKKPWFMGVEHVTVDHEWPCYLSAFGFVIKYVYWKGIHVENFTLRR